MTTTKLYALNATLQYSQILEKFVDASALLAHERRSEAESKLNEAELSINELEGEENRWCLRSYRNYLGRDMNIPYLRYAHSYLKNQVDKEKLSQIRTKIGELFSEALTGLDKLLVV